MQDNYNRPIVSLAFDNKKELSWSGDDSVYSIV